MKRVLKPSLTIVLLIFYIMASLGIGVHECSASGTVNIRLFASSKSCNEIHTICSCKHHQHDGMSEHQHHSQKCCHTTIHQLTQDYDFFQRDFKFNQFKLFDFISNYITASSSVVSLNNETLALCNRYSPPPLVKETDPYSYHSQWRL